LAALLCALTGCETSVPDPSFATPQPPVPILTDEEAKGLVSLPWTPLSPASSPQVAPSGNGFEVSVPVTGCVPRIRGVQAKLTATTVVVAVLGDPSPPTSSCPPSAAKAALVYVRLPDFAAGHVIEHAQVAG
jgi:hypothetical protein